MPTIAPFHLKGGRTYHFRDECWAWWDRPPEARIHGTAGKKPHDECFELLAREFHRGSPPVKAMDKP